MYKKIHFAVAIIFFFLISCSQVKREEIKPEGIDVKEIKARAEETSNAFVSGDHQKVVDLTYPKLVELMGGKAKMLSYVEQQMKEMNTQGFEFVSSSVHDPKEVVASDSQFFSIVPYTLKMKTPRGLMTQESYMLAISNKDSIKWSFIDVTGLEEAQLKMVVPDALGKVTFPKKQPPVFDQNP
jgi:hypothetical protein